MKTGTWMFRWAGGRRFLMLVACLALAAQLGCGDDDGGAASGELTDDQKQIYGLVGGVSDMSTTLKRLRESFTKSNAPKSSNRKTYFDNIFSVNGDITVTGDSASFSVNIVDNDDYETGAAVEKQWKAQKVNDRWLLSDTPLP